ncbi:Mitochondrial zinc maintenance protein 1, mitochondrial [Ascosphaera acerosa]|nr:Mitochondrial zinc maintenance protein 1, mitochondrial [Ascosphaera acerosa]
MTTPAVSPLAAYRHLLRATRVAFWEDWSRMHAARAFARAKFEEQRHNIQQRDDKVKEALEAARILRTEVIQGERTAENTFQLRIHDEIERGDNDSVKVKGKTVKVEKCCSS